MKNLKKSCLVLLSVLLTFICVSFPVSASSTSTETIYFEDGSYLIIDLAVSPTYTRASTKSGDKAVSFYKSDDTLQWVATVHGTFSYDGTTATATSATYSYQIYNSNWKLKSGSAYCSGNQAITECSFLSGMFVTKSVSVTLSCSPTGVLS